MCVVHFWHSILDVLHCAEVEDEEQIKKKREMIPFQDTSTNFFTLPLNQILIIGKL